MKKTELLAPAGGRKQYIAAVENGADAIYCGGPLFNARMKADNFTMEELQEMIDYGHLRNVRTYITLNTLIDDSQFEKAFSYAAKLYEAGADALIIQDMGLGREIKRAIPDFPLHLSTQGTVYNVEGVKAAARLGYDRIVLARELTLDEIRECCLTDTEIEVFVHGALCMCYSGQCQLSRHIGGRSGNRGVCAQPCRLPYSGGYPLSPKDICTADLIPSMIDAGVTSFKIEGRMKSPEYTAAVTSIYRKYIDLALAGRPSEVSAGDMQDLMQAFNRGGFMAGYAAGDPGDNLLSGTSPKNMGVYTGTVTSHAKNGIFTMKQEKPLSTGDILEIRSENRSQTMTLTYMKPAGKSEIAAGDIKGKVMPGDKVYRLVSKELNDRAAASFASSYVKADVDMTLTALSGDTLRLTASDKETGITAYYEDGLPVQAAEKKPADEDSIIRQLEKTGDTPFRLSESTVSIDDNIFLPAGRINSARRNVLASLESEKKENFRRSLKSVCPSDIQPAAADPEIQVYASSYEEYKKYESRLAPLGEYRLILPLREITDGKITGADAYIPQVTKGPYDQWLRTCSDEISQYLNENGIRLYAGNLSWVKHFADKGVSVYGDFGLNAVNKYICKLYEDEGAIGCITSLENASPEINGRYPLMITEHEMKEKTLTDRKGQLYSVSFDSFSHKTTIKEAGFHPDINRIKKLAKKETVRIYI